MAELIRWPETARVGRAIPKERLYAEAGVSAALKQRFVDEVQRIEWAFKLGEESVRLAPTDEVTEIQVFVIDLKGATLDSSVLAAIDKSVPSQIIFELRREDGLWTEQAMTAAYKRGSAKTKSTDYFRSGWAAADEPRATLPVALDMSNLYAQLLGRLLPHPMRAGENLSDAIDRMARIRGLDREISALERRVRNEVQFNRKVELRNEVRAKQADLRRLTDDDRPLAAQKDAAWRS